MCAINLDRKLKGLTPVIFPPETVLGALQSFITTDNGKFEPMNANYGIIVPLDEKIRDKSEKKKRIGLRSLQKIKEIKELINEY